MIAFPALLLDLASAGVEVAAHPADPARLLHRPAHVAPCLAKALRTHRAAILALLRGEGTPEPDDLDDDGGQVMAERLAIVDGLAMPTHVGSVAWLLAVGEALSGQRANAIRIEAAQCSTLANILNDDVTCVDDSAYTNDDDD